MPTTHHEFPMFGETTYKDDSWHHDGTYRHPRISGAIADLVTGDWDLTNFRSNRKPTEMVPHPWPDLRERAGFIFGLSKLYYTMMAIGEVEHTNDWDWFVQVETIGGKWYGDYCKDGKLYDYEDPIWGPDGEKTRYCDDFKPQYGEMQMGVVPVTSEYYENLEVVLESWEGGSEVIKETLTVGQIKRIIIAQR